MSPERIICWFSCGAASAAATKLAVVENAGRIPLEIACTRIAEEHPDNSRFLRDCAQWFGQPILELTSMKYHGSTDEVYLRERYLVGPDGAKCTSVLKKDVRRAFERPRDRQVFGYTAEEQHRVDRFIDANNHVDLWVPLIDRGMTKAQCLGMLRAAGIELPAMYLLGYHNNNNNCIGCVKGGAGYWNKIRVDFPARFERMAEIEEQLGRTTAAKATVNGVRRRVSLRELPPDAGDYPNEPDMDCGIQCEMPDMREIIAEDLL